MRSYILMSTRISRLCKLIIRNRGVSLRCIFKIVPLLFSGIISEIFSTLERIRFGRMLDEFPVPRNPVFIVSHWRTGSTLLHELIELDEQFSSLSILDTIIPDHSLISSRYYRKFVSRFIGNKRPIDNFAVNQDSASEHEYALLKMTGISPLEKAIFHPSEGTTYFLDKVHDFIPEGRNKQQYRKSFETLAKKVAMKSNKRPLFKNPWDSMRIAWLKELFPEAKFVHIKRNPEKVVPSTLRMWNKLVNDNILKGRPSTPSLSDGAKWYLRMENTISRDFAALSPEDHVSIRYEDLIADPVGTVKHVYDELAIMSPANLSESVLRYMEEKKGNKSPAIQLPASKIDEIKSVMKDFLKEHYPEITEENAVCH